MLTFVALALFAFISGFVDAIAGGGGLIQIPALLIALPQQPIPSLFSSSKFAGFFGTGLSAIQYSKRVKYNVQLLIVND
jgi:uncharacterized protein